MTRNGEMQNGETETNQIYKAPLFPSSRLLVTVMAFFGCLISYVLRLNMGFAMVCMIKRKPLMFIGNSSVQANAPECSHLSNGPGLLDVNATFVPEPDLGEFEWEKKLQGLLLGAFFYGYIITQIPAGWLCRKIGAKTVLLSGLGMLSVLTLLIPEGARISPHAVLVIRIIQGMFSAVLFPATHTLIGQWAPPTELGTLMSYAYSGLPVGTLLTFPMCGFLCNYGFAGGWPSVFYIAGILGVIFVCVAMVTVYDSAEKHPRISETERLYINSSQKCNGKQEKTGSVPWIAIFTSGPVWGIIITHVCYNWGFYTLAITLPLFMKEVLGFDIKQNGFLSSLPYICTLFVNLISGKLCDVIRRKSLMSVTATRKLFNTIGMAIPGVCMLAITFLSCNERYLAVAVLTICQAISGFAMVGGYFYNHVDIAPQYAGLLMGISNMFATIPGIMSPLLVGLLTPKGTREEWLTIFYIGAGCYAVGTVAYLILGSGQPQPWTFEHNQNHNGNQKEAEVPLTTISLKDK